MSRGEIEPIGNLEGSRFSVSAAMQDIEGSGKLVDPTIVRYSELVETHPALKTPLEALGKLPTRTLKEDLLEDDPEALLLHAVWSEDPEAALAIANDAGIAERDFNAYIDRATFDLEPMANGLYENIQKIRRIQATNITVEQTVEDRSSDQAILPNENEPPVTQLPVSEQPTIPQITRANVEEAPASVGELTQTYNHPVLSREQEQIVFKYLRGGKSLDALMKDQEFLATIDPEERGNFERVYLQSDKVEDFILGCSLRLVDVIARSYKDAELPLRDRINAGNIGLLRAIRKFDPESGHRLSTHAVWDIRYAVIDALNQHSTIKLPSYVRSTISEIQRVQGAFERFANRSATTDEIKELMAATTDIPLPRIDTALEVMQSGRRYVRSINEKLSEDSEDEKADFIADKGINVEDEVVEEIEREETVNEVRRALRDNLTEDERQILVDLFGLEDGVERSPDEIAKLRGITRQQVLSTQRRSINKLRTDAQLATMWRYIKGGNVPSFMYGRSAENAAIRLGVFSGYTGKKPEQVTVPIRPIINEPADGEIIRENDGIKQIQTEEESSPIEREDLLPLKISRGKKPNKKDTEVVDISKAAEGESNDNVDDRKDFKQDEELNNQDEREGGIKLLRVLFADEIVLYKRKQTAEPESSIISDSGSTSTINRVKDLIHEGYSNLEIANALNISSGTVRTYASILANHGQIERPQRGRRKDTTNELKVKELRDKGLSNKEISSELGMPEGTVGSIVSRLMKEGEITRRTKGRTREREGNSLISKVKILRDQGLSNGEIAEQLGASYGTIAQCVVRLLRNGEITAHKKTKGRNESKQRRDRETINEVKNLLLASIPPFEIAEKLGISTKTVAVYKNRLTNSGELPQIKKEKLLRKRRARKESNNDHYDQVKELRLQGYSNKEIAIALHVSIPKISMLVRQLIKDGEIEPRKAKPEKTQRITFELGDVVLEGSTVDKIRTLRNMGVRNQQISDILGIKVSTVRVYAASLLSSGEISKQSIGRPKTSETKIDHVKKLILQGYSNREIADLLELTYGTVRTYASTLASQGVIDPPQRGRKPDLSRNEQVKNLRHQGFGNAEIASKLNIPINTVSSIAHKLILAGEIDVLSKGRKKDQPRNPNTVVSRVKELRNQGYGNKEISSMLGISYGVVAQAAIRLIRNGEIQPLERFGRTTSDDNNQTTENADLPDNLVGQVKKYLVENPRPTFKDGFRRIFEGRERRRGKSPATIEFEGKVKELRKEGLTYYQIADKLGTNWMKVQAAAYKLIQAGELKPTRTYTKEQAKERTEKIANSREFRENVRELAEQGLTSIQIAERLQDSVRRVHFVMWRMDKEGSITLSPEQLRPRDGIGYIDTHATTPTGGHYEKVAQMRNEGKNNGEIALELGLGRHKVETLASNLIRAGVIKPSKGGRKKVGANDHEGRSQINRRPHATKVESLETRQKVLELRRLGYGNADIATMLNKSASIVSNIAHQLLQAGEIQPLQRGRRPNSPTRLVEIPVESSNTDRTSIRLSSIIKPDGNEVILYERESK